MGRTTLASNTPSPSKSHSYLVIFPSGSVEAEASKVISSPVGASSGETENAAVGATFATSII